MFYTVNVHTLCQSVSELSVIGLCWQQHSPFLNIAICSMHIHALPHLSQSQRVAQLNDSQLSDKSCHHDAGDYWPGEAENLLGNLSEEARQAGRKGNKGSLTAAGKPRAKSAKVHKHALLFQLLGNALILALVGDNCVV